jgi:hypothetical protein
MTNRPPDHLRDEFRAVVRTNALRHAAHREELGQRVDHVLTRDATVDLQRQAFPRVLVDDREPLELASARRVIKHEVPTPDVVLALGAAVNAAILTVPESSFFPLFHGHFQTFSTPEPVDPGVAESPSFSAKAPGHPAVPPLRTPLGQFQHPVRQRDEAVQYQVDLPREPIWRKVEIERGVCRC